MVIDRNLKKAEVQLPEPWEITLERYKERAKEWRDRAASLPAGARRDSYVGIAEGYERLVELIEAQHRTQKDWRR